MGNSVRVLKKDS